VVVEEISTTIEAIESRLEPPKTTDVSTSTSIKLTYLISLVAADEQTVVKIRGLPYNIRYEEVGDFFKDYKYIPQSVVLGVNYEGRKNGFGAILFENEEIAAEACKNMHKQYIGQRYVDLSVISYNDYKNFNNQRQTGGNYGGQ